MLPEQRRRKILELLQEEGSAKVAYLKELFSVTEPTIRQDLGKLEEEGYLVRSHGGAFLKTIPNQVRNLDLQHRQNMGKKAKIGKKAAEFITDGDSIILDAGTTTTEIANHLENVQNLNVVTSAINIALIIGSRYNAHVMMTGGEFKAPTLSVTGDKAAKFFDNTIFAAKLFLAATGISKEGRITHPGLSDIPVKKAMIGAAQDVYLVADSTKMGKIAFASLGEIDLVNHLVTDPDIDQQYVTLFESRGIEVIIAE